MIDASHGNSNKLPDNQRIVVDDLGEQIAAGDRRIFGVMIESHLVGGTQRHAPGQQLTYGQSITDACLGWEATVELLTTLASAVEQRRQRSNT